MNVDSLGAVAQMTILFTSVISCFSLVYFNLSTISNQYLILCHICRTYVRNTKIASYLCAITLVCIQLTQTQTYMQTAIFHRDTARRNQLTATQPCAQEYDHIDRDGNTATCGNTEIDTETNIDVHTDIDTVTRCGHDTDTGANNDHTDTNNRYDTGTERYTNTQASTDTGTDTDSGIETVRDAYIQTVRDTNIDTGRDTYIDTGIYRDAYIETDRDVEIDKYGDTYMETDRVAYIDTDRDNGPATETSTCIRTYIILCTCTRDRVYTIDRTYCNKDALN